MQDFYHPQGGKSLAFFVEKRPANKSQALKSKSDCLFQQSQKGCSKAGRQRRECCRSHENSV
jgi:hypothetical protein